MTLATMEPDPAWGASTHADAVETLAAHADALTIRVWCGDWCKDCQALLPGFAAALAAAGIDPTTVEQYPVEKADDGSKVGPGVDAYDIAYIPTILVERDGTELVRFVESEEEDPATYIADALAGRARQRG